MIYQQVVLGHVITACTEIAQGFVAINDGKVIRVGNAQSGVPSAHQVHDYSGHYIFPGVIDSQVHSRSQKDNEDFIWSTSSAAAGGVTTIVDMPYDAGSLICNASAFNKKKQEAQAQARVDFALYATINPEEGPVKVDELVKAGAAGFKFSTFGTDPVRFPRVKPKIMFEAMSKIRDYGLVVGVHNENDEVVKETIAQLQAQGHTTYDAHSKSRPIYAENLAIHEIYELGAETGCRSHVVHCSNSRGYDICQSYRSQGFKSTIEACLHYLILCEEDLARLGGKAKVNPPIRGKEEQNKLWQHLAAGNITVVSTDHVSWSIDRKTHENIFDNSSGATGLDTLLTLMVDGAVKRQLSLTRLAQVLSYNPAQLFSIQDQKGALEEGKDADLVVLEHKPYIYEAAKRKHNFSTWSPYEGLEIDYQVKATMLRGEWVYLNDQVISQPGNGKFIQPVQNSKT